MLSAVREASFCVQFLLEVSAFRCQSSSSTSNEQQASLHLSYFVSFGWLNNWFNYKNCWICVQENVLRNFRTNLGF